MTQNYNNPNTTASTIDNGADQMNTYFWNRKALIEAKKEMFFTPLADVTNMPKHFGK
jgi:N4-gp56 family major capsid protein